jgi:hypothetical protein
VYLLAVATVGAGPVMIKENNPDRQLRYLLAKWNMETLAAERDYLKAKICRSRGDSLTTRITHNTEYKESYHTDMCKTVYS